MSSGFHGVAEGTLARRVYGRHPVPVGRILVDPLVRVGGGDVSGPGGNYAEGLRLCPGWLDLVRTEDHLLAPEHVLGNVPRHRVPGQGGRCPIGGPDHIQVEGDGRDGRDGLSGL